MRVAVLAVAFGAQALLVGGEASAEPRVDRSAAAEDLFQRAKALLARRQFEPACPLLLESYRLDPAGGTLQNLSVCYEEIGKWASAYARFQELRAVSKDTQRPRPDRVALAEEHIAKLEPRLSRLVLVIPDALVAHATVTVDGEEFFQASWSTGIAVDPGTHEIVVSAPGKVPYHTSVDTANDGAQREVRVPALADEEAPAPPPHEPAPSFAGREPAPPTHRLRTMGLAVGAVGAGVLAAGGVFGILTFAANGAGKDKCLRATNAGASASDFDPATGRCYRDSPAWSDANAAKGDARTFANIANVLVPLGIVGVGVGVVLFFKQDSPSSAARSSAVRLSPSLGGASIEGQF